MATELELAEESLWQWVTETSIVKADGRKSLGSDRDAGFSASMPTCCKGTEVEAGCIAIDSSTGLVVDESKSVVDGNRGNAGNILR